MLQPSRVSTGFRDIAVPRVDSDVIYGPTVLRPTIDRLASIEGLTSEILIPFVDLLSDEALSTM